MHNMQLAVPHKCTEVKKRYNELDITTYCTLTLSEYLYHHFYGVINLNCISKDILALEKSHFGWLKKQNG